MKKTEMAESRSKRIRELEIENIGLVKQKRKVEEDATHHGGGWSTMSKRKRKKWKE